MMKLIDVLVIATFSSLFRILSKFKQDSDGVLVIQIVALGDIICSSSFYKVLSKTDNPIYMLCRRKYYDMYAKNNPYVKGFIIFDDTSVLGKLKLFYKLYKLKISTTYDLTGSYFSKWLGWSTNSWFTGIDLRKSGFNKLYNKYYEYDTDTHIVDQYFKLNPDTNDSKSLEFWNIQKIRFNESPYIVISVGAGVVSREWNIYKFIDVINYILYNTKFHIVLVGSIVDTLKGNIISKNKKIINLIGKTNINQVGYIISKSKLVVGNDSGVGHIAAALDIPVISIFGPGFYKQWKPYGRNCYIIQSNVCNPCGSNPDCKHINCLNSITSNQVIDVVKKILNIEIFAPSIRKNDLFDFIDGK